MKHCSCGKQLWSGNASGFCRSCVLVHYNHDPVTAKKRGDGLRAKIATPEGAAKHAAASQRIAAMPHVREARRQAGLRAVTKLLSPQARARAVETRKERQMGWCPQDRMEDYILWRKYYGAAEARRMIEEEIPGTLAHAKRHVSNQREVQLIRAERVKAQAY